MSDDACPGEPSRARARNSYLMAWVMPRRKRKVEPIDMTVSRPWVLGWCGPAYGPRCDQRDPIVLFIVPGPRLYCAYPTLTGWLVPADYLQGNQRCERVRRERTQVGLHLHEVPNHAQVIELTTNEAERLCADNRPELLPELIQALRDFTVRGDARPQPGPAPDPAPMPVPASPEMEPEPSGAAIATRAVVSAPDPDPPLTADTPKSESIATQPREGGRQNKTLAATSTGGPLS
jgi:hypothetical protein